MTQTTPKAEALDAEAKPLRYPRQARWREAHPLKAWAHACLRSALKRGLLTPEPCAHCGAEPAEAHHPDHARPLQVEWLCRAHHKALHAEEKRTATTGSASADWEDFAQ